MHRNALNYSQLGDGQQALPPAQPSPYVTSYQYSSTNLSVVVGPVVVTRNSHMV